MKHLILGISLLATVSGWSADIQCNLGPKPIYEVPNDTILRISGEPETAKISRGARHLCELKADRSANLIGEYSLAFALPFPEPSNYALLGFQQDKDIRTMILCNWKGAPLTIQEFMDGAQNPNVSVILPSCPSK